MHAFLKNARFLVLFFLIVSLTISITAVQQVQEMRQRAQVTNQVSIDIVEFQFSQPTITIQAGTRVTWTNRSTANLPHTTSSDVQGTANSWDSGFLNPGQSFSRTFNTPGTFAYHCNVHPSMRGTIIVTSSAITPTPTPTLTPTPTPGVPSPVCLGACPTMPPTPTVTVTPPPLITVDPSAEPTLEPCYDGTQVGAVQGAQDTQTAGYGNHKGDHGNDHDKGYKNEGNSWKNMFWMILEFFLRLLQLIFGNVVVPLPGPQPGPAPSPLPYPSVPVYPTEIIPSVLPTLTEEPAVSPYPSEEPTGEPTEYPTEPTQEPSEYPSPEPTEGPTEYPSPEPTASESPIEVTPTLKPCNPSPTQPGPTVSPGMRSIDEFKYLGGNEPVKEFNLSAEAIGGSSTQWGYDGKIHGPEIRVTEGDRVRITFRNNLPESTTVHWHGIKIFASQDGVAGVTQNAISAGDTFTYDFVVPDVGTYWYHSHQNTLNQLPKGLYGPFIVEPKKGIPQKRDYTVMYDNQTTARTETFEAKPGDTVRIRLINSREPDFTGSPVKVALVGVPFKVAAIDGQEINQPQTIESQLISMMIATRYDLVFTMPASGSVKMYEAGDLQTVQFGTGEAIDPPNLNTWPQFSYMNYGVPTADPRLPKTTFDEEHTISIGQNLSLNGKLMPDVPDLVVKEGQVIKIRYVNNSNMHHAMHLHGHFYRLLKKNEQDLTGAPIYMDTIDMAPGETVDAAVVADNPGVWMLHCHVLGHASVGMMMLMRYDDVYTPYHFGHGTGNLPE